MRSLHEDAIWYLYAALSRESFWRWDEDARGIIWVDGSTVASRDEIARILRRLDLKRPPPFGAIVQLLAACRGKQLSISWREPSEDERLNLRVPYLATSCGVNRSGWDRVRMFAEPEAISAALVRLHSIPSSFGDLLAGEENVADFVQVLMEQVGAEQVSPANGVAEILEQGELTDLELNHPPWGSKYTTLISDLAFLSKIFNSISTEALRSKLMEARCRRSSRPADGNAAIRSKPFGSERMVVQVRQFALPPFIDWRVARSGEWGFCAAGWSQNQPARELVLVRSSWTGAMQTVRWQRGENPGPIIMALPETGRAMLHVPGQAPLHDQILPGIDGVFAEPLTAGGAGWLPSDAVEMATGGWGFFLLRKNPARVAWHNSNGLRHFECAAPELEPAFVDDSFQAPITAFREELLIGMKSQLVFYNHWKKGISREYSIKDEATGLAVSTRLMYLPVCACHQSYVSILFGYGDPRIANVEQNIESARAVYTGNGTLAIIGNRKGCVYRLDCKCIRWRLPFDWPNSTPLALLSAGPQDFSSITSEGLVTIHGLRGC